MFSAVTGRASGNDSKGAAIVNQMIVTLAAGQLFAAMPCRIVKLNVHVAEEPNLALVERRIANLLASAEERDCDRDGTGATETDDGHSEESVERGGGAKVDAGQGTLDGRVEEKGIERHLETLRHFAPELVAWDTTVARESDDQLASKWNFLADVAYAQTHREAACEQAKPQERPITRTEGQHQRQREKVVQLTHEEQAEGGACGARRLEEDLGKRLASSVVKDDGQIAEGAHDDSQEDEAEGTAVPVSY